MRAILWCMGALALASSAAAQTWCYKPVYALPVLTPIAAVGDGVLYAAGDLPTPGVEVRVARFDGTSWTLLPGKFNAGIETIAETPSGLLVGGDFATIDGAPASRIARFDGNAWQALGSGIPAPGRVYAIAELGGDVYAAGSFSTAGGQACANIARYDGTSWHALGAGLDAPCETLATIGSTLYVGGGFATADGLPLAHVAAWDGAAFGAAAANGLPKVYDFTVSGDRLYAAAEEVFVLDGGAWNRIGSLGEEAHVDAYEVAIVDGIPHAAGKWVALCLGWSGGPCLAAARYTDGEWKEFLTDDQAPSFPRLTLNGFEHSMYMTGATGQPSSIGLIEFADEVALYSVAPSFGAWYQPHALALNTSCVTPGAPTTVTFGNAPPFHATATSASQVTVDVPIGALTPCGPIDVVLTQGSESTLLPGGFRVLPSLSAVVFPVIITHVDFDVDAATTSGQAWFLWSPALGDTQLPIPGFQGMFALQASPLNLLGGGTLSTTPTLRVPYVAAQVPPNAVLAVQAVVIEHATGGPYTSLTNAVLVTIP